MTRLFLAFVGAAYVVLAAWCAIQPAKTANSVGFQLQPGSGQSEYFVVYGGLQAALGLMFLLPLIQTDSQRYSLLLCLILHACLVVMRTISFALYSGISTTTFILAGVEWAILLGAAWCYWSDR